MYQTLFQNYYMGGCKYRLGMKIRGLPPISHYVLETV